MIEVAAARELVLRHTTPLPAEPTPVMSSSLGQVIATDVKADLDSPPFDKSMMDGYAVNTADLPGGFGELRVSGQIAAGQDSNLILHTATAIRIFTGAPIPRGADAVVMQERTELKGDSLQITDREVAPGKNVIHRATEMKAGEVVIAAGTRLTPATFGVLATVGKTSIAAFPRPKVAIIATGDELVEPNSRPGPGQIRNSNGPMLVGQVTRAGGLPRYLGIARDSEEALQSYIMEGLEIANVILLAGGVSVGKLDFVPKVLADTGVVPHFHKVRMKPGKPLLFGTLGNKLVFGLPGNPVSAFVGFELFVRPALQKLAGHEVMNSTTELPLTAALAANHDRPTYHPAALKTDGVAPLPWFGSADLRALLNADAFILLAEGPVNLSRGEFATVLRIDD